MLSLSQLTQILENNGIQYFVQHKTVGLDFDDNGARIELYDDTIIEIGFEHPEQKGVYYWFYAYTDTREQLMHFKQRYNSLIGKSTCTWNIIHKIEQFLSNLPN